MKNFIYSSQKYACRHWPRRRGVKFNDLRNDVVKTDSAVYTTSVCAIRKQVAWSSVLQAPHVSSSSVPTQRILCLRSNFTPAVVYISS